MSGEASDTWHLSEPVVRILRSSLRRKKIYAIIETGGKQYKVSPGDTIEVERLPVEEGKPIELKKVLLLADDDKVTVGTPMVDGARVMATSRGEIRDDKIVVLKYKSKVRYRKKTGHRQIYTGFTIDRILKPGETFAPPKKTRRTKKAAPREELPVETKPKATVDTTIEETPNGA